MTAVLILDKILALKNLIETSLQNVIVIVSTIINRSDNAKAQLTITHLNEHFKDIHINMIDNANLDEECLTKKGLHLNNKGSGKLAINMIRKIRK